MMEKLISVLQALLIAALITAPGAALAGKKPPPQPPPKMVPFSTAGIKPVGLHFHIVCRDKHGKVLAVRDPKDLDLITTVGATQLINNTFAASGFTSAWYMGEIKAFTSFSTGDTMTSHAGWTGEAGTDITNGTRPTILPIGGVSCVGATCTAVATASVFTQNSSITLFGFYITDNNTVGNYASGNLYGELTFSSFSVVATNTVTITVSIVTTAG